MRESKAKEKEKLRRRLFRERQFKSNLILAPVKARLRDKQHLRTVARVEYYNNLARLRNAREYDLEFEEQEFVDIHSTVNKSRSFYCMSGYSLLPLVVSVVLSVIRAPFQIIERVDL
jgi:hypothetical protein